MQARAALLVLAATVAGCAVTARRPVPGPEEDVSSNVRSTPARRCAEDPLVAAWTRRLRTNRALQATTQRDLARGAPYLPRLRSILGEAGVPPALALLPLVESGFRADMRGRHGERGLWQLRPATARRFQLVVQASRDDRLNAERATRGAAAYLSFLYGRYGDWPLALAAYNAGEGRVDRALARRPGATFWELARARRLPRSSCEYVPRFLAVIGLVDGTPACLGAEEAI